MDSAKFIKDQAAASKRSATSISGLVEQIKFQKRNGVTTMSDKDVEQLEKTAAILRSFGEKTATAAKAALRNEEEKARAIEKARSEAAQSMAKLPMEKMIDKVALIIVNQAENRLRDSFEKEDSVEGHRWTLDYLFEEAIRETTDHVAYVAVDKTKTVKELMNTVVAKLAEIKAGPWIEALALKCSKKTN